MYEKPVMNTEIISPKKNDQTLYEVISESDIIISDAIGMIRCISNDLFGTCVCENPKDESGNNDGFYGFSVHHRNSCKVLLGEIEYLKRRLGG